MRSIRSSGTKPELALAAAMSGIGLAFRAQDASLPGKPDFAFPGLAVFVDGAFWHGRGKLPARNREWWREKLARNAERDRRANRALRRLGVRAARLDASMTLRRPWAAAAAIAFELRRL